MKEYIDKRAVLKTIDLMAQSEAARGCALVLKSLIKARNAIDNIPDSKVVKIVMCKECKNRGKEDCPMAYYDDKGKLICLVKGNEFCSHGEKTKRVSR
jgi:hypothetical protein